MATASHSTEIHRAIGRLVANAIGTGIVLQHVAQAQTHGLSRNVNTFVHHVKRRLANLASRSMTFSAATTLAALPAQHRGAVDHLVPTPKARLAVVM